MTRLAAEQRVSAYQQQQQARGLFGENTTEVVSISFINGNYTLINNAPYNYLTLGYFQQCSETGATNYLEGQQCLTQDVFLVATNNATTLARGNRENPYWQVLPNLWRPQGFPWWNNGNYLRLPLSTATGQHIYWHLYIFLVTCPTYPGCGF